MESRENPWRVEAAEAPPAKPPPRWLTEAHLWAWMAEETPGVAGMVGLSLKGERSPLICPAVCTRREKSEALRGPVAGNAGRVGKRVFLVRFRVEEVLEEVVPEGA